MDNLLVVLSQINTFVWPSVIEGNYPKGKIHDKMRMIVSGEEIQSLRSVICMRNVILRQTK